jgi:UDP-N-acetylglucosamine 1-carboxyvinyltransferase
MDKIIINGTIPLKGEVGIVGAKNSALGILPATILSGGKCRIENVPDIQDIRNYIIILKKMGASVERSGSELLIDTSAVREENIESIEEETTKMRASYYMIGTLLSKVQKCKAGAARRLQYRGPSH